MPVLAPGSRVGTYEIVALPGAGGMGEVFRARDRADPRREAFVREMGFSG